MDEFLSKAGSQAVSFAIKSGVSLASSYAIKKISKIIIQIPNEDTTKLELLRSQLETRIEIVSSALDLIKLVAARGNTNLQYTLNLTQGLRNDIDNFDRRIDELFHDIKPNSTNTTKQLETYMTNLLNQIENVTPFINLSLTASGANLNSSLSKQISPNLLLNASNYVIKSNEVPLTKNGILIGPSFEVTLYTIFYNSSNTENPITWKETMKRCNITLRRYPPIDDNDNVFNYKINIRQNFNDGRYHDEEEISNKKDLILSIEQIKKLVFNVSGRLLKLEDNDNPVLVLKTDLSKSKNETPNISGNGTPHNKEIKWYAFGSYDPIDPDDSESDQEDEKDGDDTSTVSSCEVFEDATENKESIEYSSSVALLEYMIRLLSLQHDDNKSLLNITDERLSLYLNDENAHSKTKEKEININEVINALKNMNLK